MRLGCEPLHRVPADPDDRKHPEGTDSGIVTN